MAGPRFEVLVDGLLFPESPRWHDGELWLSEKRAGRVLAVTRDGAVRTAAEIDGEPGGLGWRPGGQLLVVAMRRRSVVAPTDGGEVVVADLSALTVSRCNDMVVGPDGNAYVGDFGYDLPAGAPPAPGVLVLVPASGDAPRIVARDLHFPNGCVITPDGRTLVVAESAAHRLSAFTIASGGDLLDRRIFAELGSTVPDGIALDASGAVWVADPLGNQVVRVAEGGEVLDRRATGQGAFACELGGPDGRSLFVCTYDAAASASPTPTPVGRVEVAPVPVPAAGTA